MGSIARFSDKHRPVVSNFRDGQHQEEDGEARQ